MEMLYGLMSTGRQGEIEMCRMKIDGVDEEVAQMYDVSEEDVYCTQSALMYHFLEQATEKQVLAHFEWGIGDYMELHDPAVVGLLLYPHLFELRYVRCEVEDGVICYDERLTKPKMGVTPNCMVVVDVDEKRFLTAFTRDLLGVLN